MYQIENHTAKIGFLRYAAHYRDPDKFIAFCKQCNQYNRCWVCPPFDFDTDEYLSGFEYVYIIGTKIIPGADTRLKCDQPEEARLAGRQMLARVRELIDPQLLEIENRYPGSKVFFAGTCFQCPQGACTRITGNGCANPDKVRPSLEAFGFDIGKTAAEVLHIDLKWSSDGRLPEYFTLVSGIFTNHLIPAIL